MPPHPTDLVSPRWLADHLGTPGLSVLDASWYLPQMGRDARAEFAAGHVPGARHADLDALCDPDTTLPHTLPAPEHFERAVRALGVGEEAQVVVYDASGTLLSAPRVWWMFRAFGHDRVAVLDGGLAGWLAAGGTLETGEPPAAAPGSFVARFRPGLVRDRDAVLDVLARGDATLVDVRAAERFRGEAAEPRPGLRAGHIPGARSLPFTLLADGSGRLRDEASLRALLAEAGVREDRPVIVSCGSGVSACALVLALTRLGRDDVAVYDGSWTEWGADASLPIESGPARG